MTQPFPSGTSGFSSVAPDLLGSEVVRPAPRFARKNMSKTGLVAFCFIGVTMAACGMGPEDFGLGSSSHAIKGKANGNGSQKAGMEYSHVALLDREQMTWTTVAKTEPLRPPGGGRLIITSYIKCGLYTDTTCKSKNGKKCRSQATSKVSMQVRVRGNDGTDETLSTHYPDCSRDQVLEAQFSGLLQNLEGENCVEWDAEANGWIIRDVDGCEESVRLAQRTWNTASWPFEFIANAGVKYVLAVEAMIETLTDVTDDGSSASAEGSVGEAALVWMQQ